MNKMAAQGYESINSFTFTDRGSVITVGGGGGGDGMKCWIVGVCSNLSEIAVYLKSFLVKATDGVSQNMVEMVVFILC